MENKEWLRTCTHYPTTCNKKFSYNETVYWTGSWKEQRWCKEDLFSKVQQVGRGKRCSSVGVKTARTTEPREGKAKVRQTEEWLLGRRHSRNTKKKGRDHKWVWSPPIKSQALQAQLMMTWQNIWASWVFYNSESG